ncbi:hypothetical protein [Neobacillus sp. LXY-4]
MRNWAFFVTPEKRPTAEDAIESESHLLSFTTYYFKYNPSQIGVAIFSLL